MHNELMEMLLQKIKEQPKAFEKIREERMEHAEREVAAMPAIPAPVEQVVQPAPPQVESIATVATRHTHQRKGGSDSDGDSASDAFTKLKPPFNPLDREVYNDLKQSFDALPKSDTKAREFFAIFALTELKRFDLIPNCKIKEEERRAIEREAYARRSDAMSSFRSEISDTSHTYTIAECAEAAAKANGAKRNAWRRKGGAA